MKDTRLGLTIRKKLLKAIFTSLKASTDLKHSPISSKYGDTEDPTLENMAQEDIAVFLMTVGDSSPVYVYTTPFPARTPNLPNSTRDMVRVG